jgi:hypothetical protein
VASRDDLGYPVRLTRPARRVVSLVPSLTESVAVTRPEALAGATAWCTHPADPDVTRAMRQVIGLFTTSAPLGSRGGGEGPGTTIVAFRTGQDLDALLPVLQRLTEE